MSKKNKILIGTLSILLVCAIVAGISYAYWKTTYVATNINKINSSCFSMELTNEKNNIIIESTYPITDEKGKSLTPYSFTITNTCDLFASYTINLEMLEGTTLNSKYIKTMINSEAISNLASLPTKDVTVDGAVESRELFKGSLGAGDSVDYTFRLWMDYDTPLTEESMNKNFQSKITVTSEVSTYSPVENGFTNLAEALLVNEYQTTNVAVAKNKIASKQEVDFSKTAPIINWTENHPETLTSSSTTKAAPSTIGSYGVVDNATKVLMGTSYTYDSAKGSYTLTNTAFYDPTTLDYENNEYYYCGSSISLNSNDKVTHWNCTTSTNLFRIKGLETVSDSQHTFDSGNKLAVKIYKFIGNNYTSQEVESDKSDKGLYNAEDDYGTTYYYRGNVSNNYVYYAGYYWRVIRINGDGSVRLLYSGKTPEKFNTSLAIGNYVFNDTKNDPTYVGYMYSNTIGVSYEDTIKNDNDSTIKTILDDWYKTNILDKGLSNVVADSGFCNNRSLLNDGSSGYLNNKNSNYLSSNSVYQKNPTLTCKNPTNDLFTLAGNSKGNEALTYPIGLITVEELQMAGTVNGYLNNLVYTNFPGWYWTMSPIVYDSASTMARIWTATTGGLVNYGTVSSKCFVRPVINLKGDAQISGGIGTVNDPFIVK